MTFTENDKLKALAIVNIFETSRPFGDYAACVVLNDGAGVSYGLNQFTHRSGSLAAVVEGYLNNGGQVGREIFAAALSTLRKASVAAVNKLASDEQFKKALRAAAVTREMKEAQKEVAFDRYLHPALEICDGHGFVLPLSLAVVYDSINHGSWERVSRSAGFQPASQTQAGSLRSGEITWITEYVRKRHFWLSNVPRLKATSYRTHFFLDQIGAGNWDLRLPMLVHGVRLTDAMFPAKRSEPGAVATGSSLRSIGASAVPEQTEPRQESVLSSASDVISYAAEKFDRVDGVVTAVTSRTDAAKSLWTTVIGTLWQAVWAVFGFFAGLPIEVWVVVAVIAAVLMLAYLYRQIELGRIRERQLKSEN